MAIIAWYSGTAFSLHSEESWSTHHEFEKKIRKAAAASASSSSSKHCITNIVSGKLNECLEKVVYEGTPSEAIGTARRIAASCTGSGVRVQLSADGVPLRNVRATSAPAAPHANGPCFHVLNHFHIC